MTSTEPSPPSEQDYDQPDQPDQTSQMRKKPEKRHQDEQDEDVQRIRYLLLGAAGMTMIGLITFQSFFVVLGGLGMALLVPSRFKNDPSFTTTQARRESSS